VPLLPEDTVSDRKPAMCGATPWHAIRSCPDCIAIWREMHKDRTCTSCFMRYRIQPLPARESYSPLVMDKRTIKWLANAARVFDEYAEERFTAHQFISWLMPDLTGKGRADRDYDGLHRAVNTDQGHWPPVIPRVMGHGGDV
jgi:hypothetical protein